MLNFPIDLRTLVRFSSRSWTSLIRAWMKLKLASILWTVTVWSLLFFQCSVKSRRRLVILLKFKLEIEFKHKSYVFLSMLQFCRSAILRRRSPPIRNWCVLTTCWSPKEWPALRKEVEPVQPPTLQPPLLRAVPCLIRLLSIPTTEQSWLKFAKFIIKSLKNMNRLAASLLLT